VRPVRLRIAGFTSFRDTQEIDFEDLDLFAITGPTGSGKSSILDAMTYALYGKAERVGDGVRQLVSQGQPVMRVELEFAIGADRFLIQRVTRSGGGPTRILLQRRNDDGQWAQAGPGSDRVRDVERMVEDLVGLDYDGFSRSVLLPQGEFHRFLKGDASHRRRILTELLGLELYGRMAGKANELAALSAQEAATVRSLLETEYADATPEALREAKAEVKASKAAEDAARSTRTEIRRIAKQGTETSQRLVGLEAVYDRVVQARAIAAEVNSDAISLRAQLRDAETSIAAQEAEVASVSLAAQGAATALRAAQKQSGTEEQLRVQLESITRALTMRASAEQARVEAAEHTEAVAELERQAVQAERDRLAAAEIEDSTGRAMSEARAKRDEVARSHNAAALLTGMAAGDPCPVCGVDMTALPHLADARELHQAEAALQAADEDHHAGQRARRDADERYGKVQHRLSAERSRVDTLRMTADKASADADALLSTVTSESGIPADVDPGEAVRSRLEQLAEHRSALTEAEHRLEAAESELERRRNGRGTAIERLSGLRKSLDRLALGPLGDRARGLGINVNAYESVEWDPEADIGAQVCDAAERANTYIEGLAALVEEATGSSQAVLDAILNEARLLAASVEVQAESLVDLIEGVDAVVQQSGIRTTEAVALVSALEQRIQRRKALEETASQSLMREQVMRSLAQSLRSDRLVAFVLNEALEALALAASAHLANLSNDRYRLSTTLEDFEVVDTWNGEESRSVRTLSGGETFLASLALALALAQQVATIGVDTRVRLDSLFLDEGFGTLDPETLETVISAIDLLGESGRMVGVVTHVSELADRLPTRFVVTKSPRGSHVVRDSAARA
jgi:exonuclease SbcC